MGTWGTKILEDDAALDAYGEYIDQYNLGATPEQIRQRFEEKSLFRDRVIIDNTPFWLGLALAQWECGALDDDVLAIVQQTFDEDLEQEIWEADYPARKKILARLLKKLAVPTKKPRKRVKPRLYSVPFRTGDCLAFRHADGNYGAAVCVSADREKTRYAGAILVTTRISQPNKPTLAEVAASHVMIKEWFTSSPPEAAVEVHVVHDQKSALEAQQLEVIGRLEITRSFGETLYGQSFGWNVELYGNLQFPWEREHSDSPLKFRLPIAQFITRRDDEWGKLGEIFAQHMQKQDRELGLKTQAEFVQRWTQLSAGDNRSLAIAFLVDYVGVEQSRVETWVDCIVRNQRQHERDLKQAT
ncbi:hypothetical protein [Anatilimnocola floriformis]|uniref:hypothetical protein n=1 Tax=Anatilimnocola floriformis TaxID=2948575 RepID=UPI0020C3E22B|nr:hypothetical protein [Anatilimnocola floriformis]